MATMIKYPFGQSASIGGAEFILVTTLPTASASTMGDIYLVPRSGSSFLGAGGLDRRKRLGLS